MFSKLKERLTYLLNEVEEDWEIGIAKQPASYFINHSQLPEITWLPKSRSVFHADPFGIYQDGIYYIFYEEYLKDKGYGRINCMTLDANLNKLEDRVVIDEGNHFSFPLVFMYQGTYYMLPETIAKGKLCLYKAVNFPFEWEEHKTLINEALMDSALFYENGKWWLFYSKGLIENSNSVFFIRSLPDLFGDWEAAPETAIEQGANNARAAGNLLRIDKQLYRPAQNCAVKYGESLMINRLDNLSLSDYKETFVKEIKGPSPYFLFHTLSACGNYTLVDGKRTKLYPKTARQIIKSLRAKLLR